MTKKNEIEKVVEATVSRLRREGLLRGDDDAEYRRGGDLLKRFYKGDTLRDGIKAEDISRAIASQRSDAYYELLPLYYGDGATIERLAEYFVCDVATVYRNKRRLVIEISKAL